MNFSITRGQLHGMKHHVPDIILCIQYSSVAMSLTETLAVFCSYVVSHLLGSTNLDIACVCTHSYHYLILIIAQYEVDNNLFGHVHV
jgi:hypothetical protein